MTGPVPADVLAAYGLHPAGVTPVASAYRAAAAYRVGGVLLKPYRYRERQLYYATMALQHLHDCGFPLVPRLVRTRAGAPYVRVGSGVWYATTWLDGRPPQFPAELASAAESVARFHQASSGCRIPWSSHRSWPRRWRSLLLDLLAFDQLARRGDTPFDRSFAVASPAFIERAKAALGALDRSDYGDLEARARKSGGFCHRDCTAANLVVQRDATICLVDPDTWGPELRLHDLTRLLAAGAPTDAVAAQSALAAYEAICPLTRADRQLLPAALSLPREFWWAGVCHYRRPAPGVDPEQLLRSAIAGAPLRDACVAELRGALS